MNADLWVPTPPPSPVLSQGLPAALLSGWSCCRRFLFCFSFSFFVSSYNLIQSQVAEDRGPELPSATCRCEKATRLCEEIQSLGRRVAEAGQVVTSNSYEKVHDHLGVQLAERVGGQLPPGMLEGLGGDIAKVAHTLRWDIMSLIVTTHCHSSLYTDLNIPGLNLS